jgi:hypothetical protein
MKDEGKSTFSFVVRMWKIVDDSGETTWRGSIERVPDGSPLYFQTLDGLFGRIEIIVKGIETAQKKPMKSGMYERTVDGNQR